MLDETFFLDGIDAKTVGINLQNPIQFTQAVPKYSNQSIPGRNGDLIFETDSYENRTGTAKCFCLQKNVEIAISASGRFLMGKPGYRRLETSDDPDHFWMARVKNSPAIDQRLQMIAPFQIKFDCKPQRFLNVGENPIEFTEPGTLYNEFGQTALPFITVYGTGFGWLTIGDSTVDVKRIDGTLFLDSDTQNAYNEDGNQNANVNAPNFPKLKSGENVISFGGDIERIEIIPRWWEL